MSRPGELPVVLAVESRIAAAEGRPPPQLYGHPDVMAEVRQYRLRELQSTGGSPVRTVPGRELRG